jgi:hypothetical protein
MENRKQHHVMNKLIKLYSNINNMISGNTKANNEFTNHFCNPVS